MRLLLDTHTLIWFTGDGSNLSKSTATLLGLDETELQVSIASLWEISIKVALGRLEVEGGFENLPNILAKYDIQILDINFQHVLKQSSLPFHHKDPFDRIIASQSLVEAIDLVSVDDIFDDYFESSAVKRIW